MAVLNCGATNCTYNQDNQCCKGEISIGGRNAYDCGDTCCESFAERREGHDAFTSATVYPSKVISIDCDAVKCIYNSDYKCGADHVEISGCGADGCRETSCATFQER